MYCPECFELGEKNKIKKIESCDALYVHGDSVYQCPVCYHEEEGDHYLEEDEMEEDLY